MRVALVHYWLVGMRGGEKVLESLCDLFPGADIFTLFYEPAQISAKIRSHRVSSSFLNPFRFCYRSLLPLMPLALEQFDLRGYDLVISSESGPAKGVLVSSDSKHVCYCHSPMRYLWELYPAYMNEWVGGPIRRWMFAPIASYLRLWDYASAARVDQFVANSQNVRNRIRRSYQRDAEVVYPPVPVETFYWKEPDDYYLIVSALVPYKRLDYAVALFSRTGRKLKLVGDGPEFKRLKALAAPNVEFCGWVTEHDLRELYARSRALLMPGEEDFSMATVESLASGKPVVALGRGGVCEVAVSEMTGSFLYPDPSEEGLKAALVRFESMEAAVNREEMQQAASEFSSEVFNMKIRQILSL